MQSDGINRSEIMVKRDWGMKGGRKGVGLYVLLSSGLVGLLSRVGPRCEVPSDRISKIGGRPHI